MEPPQETCKRGRPREFDECAALESALTVFWKKGYEGASLTDLTEAMGINRPSLYAAFGNKESLFRMVMNRYAERGQALARKCSAEKTARQFVECLLRGAADGFGNRRGQAGCFMIQGAMTCPDASDAVQREIAARRMSTVTVLRDRFEKAAKFRELPKGTSAQDLATYFTAVIQGMAVRATDGATQAELNRVVDLAMKAWPVI